MSIEEILRQTKDDRRVKVAIADVDGILRGKFVHRDKFESILQKGFGFCDVVLGWDMADECYDNVSLTGWHTGYPDANVRLDPNTFRRIPWNDNIPFVLGEFVTATGEPHPICPRQLLRSVIQRGLDMGYDSRFGLEFE